MESFCFCLVFIEFDVISHFLKLSFLFLIRCYVLIVLVWRCRIRIRWRRQAHWDFSVSIPCCQAAYSRPRQCRCSWRGSYGWRLVSSSRISTLWPYSSSSSLASQCTSTYKSSLESPTCTESTSTNLLCQRSASFETSSSSWCR